MITLCNGHENDGYEEFELSIKRKLESFGDVPFFTTTADGLFDLFLAHLPEESRQHYNCNACRAFVNRFGGLVTIEESGEIRQVMWDNNCPALFQSSQLALVNAIYDARVSGVFLSKNKTLGTPVTGEWTHMHAILPKVFEERLHTVHEAVAEKKADFILLKQSMGEYPIEAINQALLLLRTDALYRSEKVLGVAEWFKSLHDACKAQKNGKLRDNLIWRAVALAPPGYCHLKNTMIGTLLDDIVAGMPIEDVSRRFAAKMHPLQYQRPQAAPTAGNIERAEAIVAKLGIERSLIRRFARLDEVQAVWRPRECQPDHKSGVFSHLAPKGKALIKTDAPMVTITWKKFAETVLPDALSMELVVPYRGNFMAVLTAEHMDAPPIIQWDSPECRNPFSWYQYHAGSYACDWGISEGWCKVTAICLRPSMWQDGCDHQGNGAMFLLEGAKDSRKGQGNALFPEILKADLREVRSTIEAYSHSAEIQGYENASACGIGYEGSTVRVTNDLGIAVYKIDRWD